MACTLCLRLRTLSVLVTLGFQVIKKAMWEGVVDPLN